MSHLIGVFGGSDEDERPSKENKKKSSTQYYKIIQFSSK